MSEINFNELYNKTNGTTYDSKESAKNPWGEAETEKYLWETGLQSVFDQYKQNIATLSEQEQRQLQDAYYIKEMSTKYLGEYASNTGISDVSGNLLDIYGKYQQNINDISKNYNDLELTFQKEYAEKRLTAMQGILESQYKIEVGKFDAGSKEVLSAISLGETDGMSTDEYIQNALDTGKITPDAAITLRQAAYALAYDDTYQNLYRGNYGVDAQGNRITDPMQFIEANKQNVSPADYEKLVGEAQYIKFMQEDAALSDEFPGSDVMLPKARDKDGNLIDNPNYIGDNVNFSAITDGENVDNTSFGFISNEGVRYFSVVDVADNDPKVQISSADIMKEFNKIINSDPDRFGGTTQPQEGNIIDVFAYSVEQAGDVKTQYVFHQNAWRRLVPEVPTNEETMGLWSVPENGTKVEGEDFSIKLKGNTIGTQFKPKVEATFNGSNYKGELKDGMPFLANGEKASDKNSIEGYEGILEEFKKVHGAENEFGIKYGSVILYNGEYYYFNTDSMAHESFGKFLGANKPGIVGRIVKLNKGE